jgi:hypothetical protein
VNTIRLAEAKKMYEAGAHHVFAWRMETAKGVLPRLESILEGRDDDQAQALGQFDRTEIVD